MGYAPSHKALYKKIVYIKRTLNDGQLKVQYKDLRDWAEVFIESIDKDVAFVIGQYIKDSGIEDGVSMF